jgi:thiol:disulfide interchange protein DsbD
MYMIPGMFGAPLRGLSGWLPPEQTQDFYLTNNGTGTASAAPSNGKIRLPEGLEGYSDYEQALAESKKTGKPVFIDFTGKNCANCRKMEANVWPDPKVLSRLKNDYIIVSLYVDDKTELPENERYISKYDNKQKTTVGARNADLQITKFNNNAQPYYCLINAEGNLLATPVGYTSVDEFASFLNLGLQKDKN